jgi:hypothetical protein
MTNDKSFCRGTKSYQIHTSSNIMSYKETIQIQKDTFTPPLGSEACKIKPFVEQCFFSEWTLNRSTAEVQAAGQMRSQ